MSKISNQLAELVAQKKNLVDYLNAKGQTSSEEETFNTLIPKILNIVSGDVNLGSKEITQDGTYNAYEDNLDGYSQVNVNILGDNNALVKYGDISGTVRYLHVKSKGDLPSYAWYGTTGKLRELELSDCKVIGRYALNGATALLNISNNTTIEEIGDYALYNCSQAQGELVLSDKITNIPPYTFYGCQKLKLNIPKNLEKADNNCFRNCYLLEGDLPDTLKTVGSSAFQYCKNLTAEKLPVITSMQTYAFAYSGIKIKEIPYGATTNSYAFGYCDNITEITINSTGTLSSYCFQYCSNLAKVVFGENLSTIATYAFRNCTSLTTVICHKKTPPTLTSNAFYNCSALAEIRVPASALETYKSASNWSNYADIMVGIEGE